MGLEEVKIVFEIIFTDSRWPCLIVQDALLDLRKTWVEKIICLWGEFVVWYWFLLELEELMIKDNRVNKKAHVYDTCSNKNDE